VLTLSAPLSSNIDGAQKDISFAKNISQGEVLGVSQAVDVEGEEKDGFREKPDYPVRKDDSTDLYLEAKSGILLDNESNEILFAKNIGTTTPIASITKLMTALVFLDHSPAWDKYYTIKEEDRRNGGKIFLYLGDKVKIRDLFRTSLIASANTATMAMVHSLGLTEEEFVLKMNKKCREMGLEDTFFSDVTGLSNENISTAHEVAEIVRAAMAKEEIRRTTLKKSYSFITGNGTKKDIDSTDKLLTDFPYNGIDILGGKTGYTNSADYCFAGYFGRGDDKVISVVLGADARSDRFEYTKDIINWSYDNYFWPSD
jgi:D-alanyl-D-alanine carboxypeptidase